MASYARSKSLSLKSDDKHRVHWSSDNLLVRFEMLVIQTCGKFSYFMMLTAL